MILIRLLRLILIFLSLTLFAQKEASQWHFGIQGGLNFLTASPAIVSSSINAIEGCASMADAAGNLLFYTNGALVWDKNHNLMTGTIGGNPSSVQSSLIFKKTGNQYYVFTTGAFGNGSFGYSIVDMALAGGNGSITTSQVLLDSVAEKLTATYHCDGARVWVLVHKMGSNAFYSYLVSSTGVNFSPVVSNIGPSYLPLDYYFGSMKFSPNSSYLCVTTNAVLTPSLPASVELYLFNNTNGQVNGAQILETLTNTNFSCPEFSPDGSKIYCRKVWFDSVITGQKFMLQWDLCAGTQTAIAASATTVGVIQPQATASSLSGLQNAPDGKIYFRTSQLTLGRINSPNLGGASCNLVSGLISLPSPVGGDGMPNFIPDLFRQKASFSSSVSTCGNVSFTPSQFCTGSGNTVNAYKWLFGDPSSGTANTSTLANASHVYAANGNYTVGLIVYYPCYTDTTFQTVSISGLPSLTVTGKNTICAGERTTFTLSGSTNYAWNGAPISTTHSVNPTSTTVYTVSAYNVISCQVSKTITLTVLPCVSIDEYTDDLSRNIYPNPNTGVFNIDLFESSQVKISDISGKEVYSNNLPIGVTEINLKHCSKGVYFVELKTKNLARTFKLVIH